MIGIVIMAILVALAGPTYKGWIANSKIRNAAESILNGLQLARAEAIRRNTPVSFALGVRSNWTVSCPACAPTTIQSRTEGEGSSSDVTVAAPDGTTFTFDNFGQVTSPIPGIGFAVVGVDINTAILSAADSRDLQIVIYKGGNIRMCDPNVATVGDSRKCP